MPQNPNNLCWLDMEMTGLDPERERIIEVAMSITDPEGNVLAHSDVYAIPHSDEVHAAMDEWNTATHGQRLTARLGEGQLQVRVEDNHLTPVTLSLLD